MSQGLTRREFVRGTMVGAGALAGLGGNPFFSALAAEPVKRGGVWRYARNRTVPSMDGHRVSEYFTCTGVLHSLCTRYAVWANLILAREWREGGRKGLKLRGRAAMVERNLPFRLLRVG